MTTEAQGNTRLLKLAGMLEKMDPTKYRGDVYNQDGKGNSIALWAKANPKRWPSDPLVPGWPVLKGERVPLDSVQVEFCLSDEDLGAFWDFEDRSKSPAETAKWIRKFVEKRAKKAARKAAKK